MSSNRLVFICGALALAGCGIDQSVGVGSSASQSGSGGETESATEGATDTDEDPCSNGVQDGDETDVDCGGSCEGKCGSGQGCGGDEDCEDGTQCTDDGICGNEGEGNCEDGIQNGDETDVDCGGSCPDQCGDGGGCAGDDDCVSGVCEEGMCSEPDCEDGIQNGDETDVDCGGSCPPCDDGDDCIDDVDCLSMVCEDGICVDPSCVDGVQNGDETDVDCGGSCPPCDDGDDCLDDVDCMSMVCDNGTCAEPACDDGVLNGDETDVDCGQSCGPTCEVDEDCLVGTDCVTGVCDPDDLVCLAPACDDGVQNGDETDVDCGQTCGRTCEEGEGCIEEGDCISGGCDGASMTCDPNVSVVASPACSDFIGAPVQLTATAADGTGSYTYSWSPAAGLDDPTSATPLATVTGFTTYTVTVDDGLHQAMDSVTVVDAQPFNLENNCTLYTATYTSSPDASISYSVGGTVACEAANNDFGLHLCEGVTFQDTGLVGTIGVSDADGDDDWIGVVWGAQSNYEFYSLVWKANVQNVPDLGCVAPSGMVVKRVHAPDFASMLGEDIYCDTDTANSTSLLSPSDTTTSGWQEGEAYTVSIDFSALGSDITVTRISDSATVASFSVTDTTWTSGYIGSTTMSQANACTGPLFASCL